MVQDGLPTDDLWSEIVPTVLRIPISAYKHRHRIVDWWKRLVVAAGKGRTEIVVTGHSASGKSLLTCRMRGVTEDLMWDPPALSRDIETSIIEVGKWAQIVRIIPGQGSQERDLGLHEAFSTHENLNGVIHVVDYGYTPQRDTAVRKDLIERYGYDTLEKIRMYNLQIELEEIKFVFNRIHESINRCGHPLWLLVAVNKADLFTTKIDEAQRYYHPVLDSAFTSILHDLLKKVGSDNIICDVVPVSSWDADFEWNGEVVPSNIGGTSASRAMMRNFIQMLSALSEGVK